MRTNNSGAGCITAFVSGFSRIMLLMVWISRPVQWNLAFDTFILPCLGFLVLPFTTLMYVWMMQGPGGVQGLDWLWLILAAILDLASIGGAGYSNRDRIPAGYRGSYQEKELSAMTPAQERAMSEPPPAAPAAPPAPDQPTESKPQ
jgi:hypothetical protein